MGNRIAATDGGTLDGRVLELARGDRRNLFDAERLNAAMRDAGLDAVVALSGVNVTYTGGAYTRGENTRLRAAVTTRDKRQALVLNAADACYFREYSWVKDVRSYQHSSDMRGAGMNLLADTLSDLGLGNARVGIEMELLSPVWNEQLRARLPKVTWSDASPVFERTRRIKTPGEIELFRVAALCTLKAVQMAWAVSRPGDTEKRMAARIQATALELGADHLAGYNVKAGTHSIVAHAWPIEKPILPGEVVHIDCGAVFGGYQTDLARNAVVGRPNPKQVTIYKRLWEIQHKLFDKVKPGLVVGELWDFAQQEFDRVGLVHPWGLMGHGTGLAVHEGFELTRESKLVLEAGMLVNIEPSHIEAGDACYHIEDTLLVTGSGCELLSDLLDSPTMTVIR